MKSYGKLLLIVIGIPGLIIVLMASTQALESSTDPSSFLDFITDTLGDTSDVALFYAKFELCPISLDYFDPIDTIWDLRIPLDTTYTWESICGFQNTGCIVTNILYHVDITGVPWTTSATPPIENDWDKFLLWALTLFRDIPPMDTMSFMPGGDKEVCILDVVVDEDDYVTTGRFFNPLISLPYPGMDSLGLNLEPSDSFWVSLCFTSPWNISDRADTTSEDPIIVKVTAEPAANR